LIAHKDAAAATEVFTRYWPALTGTVFAVLIALGVSSGLDLAPVLAAAAVVYLGSAAVQRPRAAWPIFIATAVIITAAKLSGRLFDPTWSILGLGLVFLIYGLARHAWRPAYGLPLQALALLAFGGVAAVALTSPGLGGYLVAGGLLAHAGWDLHHYRATRVVAPSMALFCMFLDVALAIVIITVVPGAR
jgi:hypothetical protein